MNTREKLLLMWAVTATLLLGIVGIIALQMFVPRQTESAILEGAYDLRVGEIALYECVRASGRCAPTTPDDARFVNFSRAASSGSVDEYAVIWVARTAPTEWRAFSAVSTHLGCFVQWRAANENFVDPCGGAKWLRDGTYWQGPAPRDLDHFAIRVEHGLVWMDFQLQRGKNHD